MVAAGDPVFASDIGHAWIAQVIYTASGTFTKATYPSASKIRVRCQAGGGGGGGAATSALNNTAAAGGGQGGGYAESMLDVSGLATSVTVTVGAAGTAGSAGANNGGAGGNSSFGATVVAGGGTGGTGGGSGATFFFTTGGRSTQTLTGDIKVAGSEGSPGIRCPTGDAFVSGQAWGGAGGSSYLGGSSSGVTNGTGQAGKAIGGGGSGGCTIESVSAVAGGAGAIGTVIIDVYV
jgi:hypothetical protein